MGTLAENYVGHHGFSNHSNDHSHLVAHSTVTGHDTDTDTKVSDFMVRILIFRNIVRNVSYIIYSDM